ncbi:CdaR family transcriptional regulator [Pseudonocardia sp. MH-G8]|uniref:PucR family transcriptional regulator n=1 Tax=Pseudonocardia sp. MH-G8 TaxID=1854588 RepID=UPI000B9FE98E|nr:helix-turn-helix domain-containing protein [Pseudonocardia sp. MH-G8]OZM83939.1 PucR family transcriptional regulator [Pseudonocardia sp. MH-G8]
MITVAALVDAVGPALLRLTRAGDGTPVGDVTLAEPAEDIVGVAGDLVLGIGLTSADAGAELVGRAAAAGASGVVVKPPLARDPRVEAVAERTGLAVVELAPHASWTHLVWLLRGVLDRAAGPGPPTLGDAGVHGELLALADAAAVIIDAPVTIEDAQSRVLAHSARQEHVDPARVSTIVGRRVPDEVVAHFRARGVFRRLARTSEPLYITDVPKGSLPRLVIPVRAGGEWLGSIWAVVAGPVAADRVEELVRAASVLALHLLRLRAQAGVARRASIDQLREALRGTTPAGEGLWLPDGPWRVVALHAASTGDDTQGHLDLWESITRRFGWHQPLLVDLDGGVFALVSAHGRAKTAGSMSWIQGLVDAVHDHDPTLEAAVGGVAATRAELPRSRAEAAELRALLGTEPLDGPLVAIEDAWDTVVVARARSAVRPEAGLLGGPLPALLAHDRDHHTDYRLTLATWLRHAGEPKATAAALRVHPNTLRYRMRRMREVADWDLGSPQVRLALQLQLCALDAGGQEPPAASR